MGILAMVAKSVEAVKTSSAAKLIKNWYTGTSWAKPAIGLLVGGGLMAAIDSNSNKKNKNNGNGSRFGQISVNDLGNDSQQISALSNEQMRQNIDTCISALTRMKNQLSYKPSSAQPNDLFVTFKCLGVLMETLPTNLDSGQKYSLCMRALCLGVTRVDTYTPIPGVVGQILAMDDDLAIIQFVGATGLETVVDLSESISFVPMV
jgi:hypothetical protein